MSKVKEAVKEASISVACLLDSLSKADDLNCELDLYKLQIDIKHLQDKITIIENFLEEVSDEL